MKGRKSTKKAEPGPVEAEESFESWFSRINRERHRKAAGWEPSADGVEVRLDEPPPANTASAPPETFSVEETAKFLGVAAVTVYRLIQRGKLRCLKSLRHKRIPRAEVERFMKNDLG